MVNGKWRVQVERSELPILREFRVPKSGRN